MRAIVTKEKAGEPTFLVIYSDNGEVARVDISGSRGRRLVVDIMNADFLDEALEHGK